MAFLEDVAILRGLSHHTIPYLLPDNSRLCQKLLFASRTAFPNWRHREPAPLIQSYMKAYGGAGQALGMRMIRKYLIDGGRVSSC